MEKFPNSTERVNDSVGTYSNDELLEDGYNKYMPFLRQFVDKIDESKMKDFTDMFHVRGITKDTFQEVVNGISDAIGINAPPSFVFGRPREKAKFFL